MPIISSIDITSRRIFLDAGIVALDDVLAFWGEYRTRRANDTEGVRKSVPVMTVIGGQPKGGGKFVGRVIDLNGYKIVPQDSTHDLDVTIEIIDSSAGLSGRDVFDRAPLTPGVEVNIDINIAPVEIQVVEVDQSGLTTEESEHLLATTKTDDVIEGALTRAEVERIVLAALAGKASGAGTTEISYRDQADTKDRIVATVDDAGNRSLVTVDGA